MRAPCPLLLRLSEQEACERLRDAFDQAFGGLPGGVAVRQLVVRVGCPAFSGQLNWCYFMLRAAGSGTRRGPLADACTRVPNGDESDCTGARCTAQYPLEPSFS